MSGVFHIYILSTVLGFPDDEDNDGDADDDVDARDGYDDDDECARNAVRVMMEVIRGSRNGLPRRGREDLATRVCRRLRMQSSLELMHKR